jgi:hypothetical protein
MQILSLPNRLASYYNRHGLMATMRRGKLAAKRGLFANRMVVFYCDLAKKMSFVCELPPTLRVERLSSYSQLNQKDLESLMSFWNPKLAHRNIRERFEIGANLWLTKSGDQLAGYGWTLKGRTITPYFFPIGENDVQLFDFYAFPKFRGRAIHWLLTAYILQTMATEGRTRAFGDTAEWNEAQLSSFKMTHFRPLGSAKSMTILGHTFVSWVEYTNGQQTPQAEKAPKPAQSNTSPAQPRMV